MPDKENAGKIDATSKERMQKYKEDKIRLRLWTTKDEYEEIQRKAQECNLSFSEYVRRCALQRKTIPKTDSAFIATLSKLGGLQNKIMMEIHDKAGHSADQVEELLPEARKIYREILLAVRRIKKISAE